MKLKLGIYKFSDGPTRERYARMFSRLVDPSSDHAPYMPNEGDDTFWRIDLNGNNWTVKFNQEDGYSTFYLNYRHNSGSPEVEKALFGWLKVKWPRLELIEENSENS